MASSNTQKVNERLQLAEQAAAAGNYQAAVNYAKAASAYSKSASSNTNVQNIISAYSNAANAASTANISNTIGSNNYAGNSGGGSSPSVPSPAPVYTPPPPPDPTTYSVKQPSPSLVQYDSQTLPQELIEDLLYEQVGGQELINMARHDTINGQDVSYSLIRNLSILNQNFNPNNILAGQVAYTLQLGEYALDIANKLSTHNPVYLDENGNLIIELSSIGADEFVEAEISTNGTIYRLGAA